MFANIVFIGILVVPIVIYIIARIQESTLARNNKKKDTRSDYDSKILVDLSQCKLSSRTSSYTKEGDNYSPRSSVFPLLDTKHQNNTTIDMHGTFVDFTHNAKKYIGGPIDKDQISAHVRLLQKKTTFIYYNQANPSDYFFDLSFMNEE